MTKSRPPGDPESFTRREVFFAGRVQGVGFRFTTQRIAAVYEVVGWVRNLSDGRVQLVVEGAPHELKRFIGHLRREMSSYIKTADEQEQIATGEFTGFEIR